MFGGRHRHSQWIMAALAKAKAQSSGAGLAVGLGVLTVCPSSSPQEPCVSHLPRLYLDIHVRGFFLPKICLGQEGGPVPVL